MGALEAVGTVISLLNAATTALGNATQVSQLIASAQAAGRDLTPEEVALVKSLDDAARAMLVASIQKAES